MATIDVFTAIRSKEIEDTTVVSGSVNTMGNLILATRAGIEIDAGHVKGETGDQGVQGLAGIPGGTTAQRDAKFGIPSNDSTKSALANQSISWYNIDKQWFETYKATNGTAGLTVPGVTGASGWYSIGGYDLSPKGLVYNQPVSSYSNDVIDSIVSYIASFTFKANRHYRLVWDTSYKQSVVSDLFYWNFNLAPVGDAAGLKDNLTPLGGRTKGVSAPNVTQHTGLVSAYYTPTVDTTMQVKTRVQRVVGTGTMNIAGSVGEQAIVQIYDDGGQTLPTP